MHYIWKDSGVTQSETSDKFTKQFLNNDLNGTVECAAINSTSNKSIETVAFTNYYGK